MLIPATMNAGIALLIYTGNAHKDDYFFSAEQLEHIPFFRNELIHLCLFKAACQIFLIVFICVVFIVLLECLEIISIWVKASAKKESSAGNTKKE
jgi:hypothetical protein